MQVHQLVQEQEPYSPQELSMFDEQPPEEQVTSECYVDDEDADEQATDSTPTVTITQTQRTETDEIEELPRHIMDIHHQNNHSS